MAGYQRFVAYVYEYRKGKKDGSSGYVRVEAMDRKCRMEVHLRCVGLEPGSRCRVYGFVRREGLMDGILIGSCVTGREQIECVLETETENIGGMGKNLRDLGGMLLISDAGGFWGTEWDDQPIRPENFREWKKEKESENQNKSGGENFELEAEPKIMIAEEVREEGVESSQRPDTEVPEIFQSGTARMGVRPAESGPGTAGVGSDRPGMHPPESDQNRLGMPSPEQGQNYPGQGWPESMSNRPDLRPSEPGPNPSGMRLPEPDSKRPGSRPPQPGPNHPNSGSRPPESGPRPPKPPRPLPGISCDVPFNDGQFTDCRKIKPSDCSVLCKQNGCFCNNRFVIYGYQNFGHLLLCRNHRGQYILGVPGGYSQQERFMANMFGFPYFKECLDIHIPGGKGGYWYCFINI